MGDLHTSSPNALKTTLTRSLLMLPAFLDVEAGDVVTVKPPHAAAYLAATPVHANTWETYATAYVSGSDFPPNNGSWLRQLDVKSVARHAGWTHVNTRSCKEDEACCRPTTIVSVHYGKALYKYSIIEVKQGA